MVSDYMTVPEVAGMLRLTERTTYELVRLGRIPGAAKVGGQWRLSRKALTDWLARGGEAATKPARQTTKKVTGRA